MENTSKWIIQITQSSTVFWDYQIKQGTEKKKQKKLHEQVIFHFRKQEIGFQLQQPPP